MAMLDDALTPVGEPATAPRGRRWPRVVAGFAIGAAIGFALCLGLAAGALYAWDAGYEGRVLPGVAVGGVDLSGLDRDEAAAALSAAFDAVDDGQVVVRTTAGDIAIAYSEFSRRADVDAMVDEALRAGRTGSPVDRAVGEVRQAMSGTTIQPRLVLDEAALSTRIHDAVAALDRAPIDGRVFLGAAGPYTTPERAGRTFDRAGAAAAALDAVRRVDAPSEVVVEATMTEVPPAHGDREALAAKVAAVVMAGDVVVTFGEDEWTIKAATVRSWLRLETRSDGTVWPVVDRTAIPAALAKVTKAVAVAPVSATYLKTGRGRIVGVVAAKDGRKLDPEATAAAIADAVTARADGAAPAPVAVQTTKIPPKVSTAEALQKGPLMVKLGSWKTWFPVSERNYFGANIWLPAKIIDGTVLAPGQRFEWWSALGPVTPSRGFGPGGLIAGDRTEPTGALGGGMCSSSTTLFNAALRAGLDMGARSNHTYYINRYPLGLDATVSKTRRGSQTVSFTNDMKNPIVIRTFRYRAGGKGWVRYEIWGIPDGRTVTLSKPVVSNLRKAVTKTEYVSTLRPGARLQVEYPADGMNVSVTRVVRRNGAVIHRDTYRSQYVLWNGLVQIGR